VHQVVLVELVLASRRVAWPPEVEYLAVSVLAVLGSFGLGALLVRIPGASRIFGSRRQPPRSVPVG
jgi:glucans biosynthesis protein C